MSEYLLGTFPKLWGENGVENITFVVTEDCNLRCGYCYITHKKSNKKMTFEIARDFIDYIFDKNVVTQPAVILDFIGGEPLLEIELINQIVDYYKMKAFMSNSDLFWNYRINICTNGVNYHDKKIQKFIKRNLSKLFISITLDGIKEKHDMHRVDLAGNGSYEAIEKNIPLWLSQFPGTTKVTFASKDLPFLFESIIHLWKLGITDVASNVVFEDVWQEGDDLILENQLKKLADYSIENHLYNKNTCTFFSDSIGSRYDKNDLNLTNCGAGKMIAVGPNGILYPCIRYKDYSLNKNEERKIGDVKAGIDYEKLRPFILAAVRYQSDEECLSCKIATGCGFCQGFNYDESNEKTNFYRAKYICNMHKARVRANDYYFNKLHNIFGINRIGKYTEKDKLYVIVKDDFVTYCQTEVRSAKKRKYSEEMSQEIFDRCINYANLNFYDLVILHSKEKLINLNYNKYVGNRITHILPIELQFQAEELGLKDCIYVLDKSNTHTNFNPISEGVLNIDSLDIYDLDKIILDLFIYIKRIELNIINLDEKFNIKEYERKLLNINDYLIKQNNVDSNKELNVITDYLGKDINDTRCQAGDRNFAVSPNGNLYNCAVSYIAGDKPIGIIGDLGFNKNRLNEMKFKPLCSECEAVHCNGCSLLNLNYTLERNVPPSFQCLKSLTEKKVSTIYASKITGENLEIESIQVRDPFMTYISEKRVLNGLFKLDV